MNQFQSLQMFPEDGGGPPVAVAAMMYRDGDGLFFSFVVEGAWAGLRLAKRVDRPLRQDGLWQSSCFECFIAEASGLGYWEINLAPSGHWQCYRFSDYRQGMAVEPLVVGLASSVTVAGSSWRIAGRLSGLPPLAVVQPLVAGLSCVLEGQDCRKSYWALAHCGSQPDFHLRRSFTVKL